MATTLRWIEELPEELRRGVEALLKERPSAVELIDRLRSYFVGDEGGGLPPKKRRTMAGAGAEIKAEIKAETTDVDSTPELSQYESGRIDEQEIIFELPQISFQSPVRKKLSLIFHLVLGCNQQPTPVMLIVRGGTYVPEFTVSNLAQLIRLCVLLPILGNSTISSKRNIGLLCFWMNETAGDALGKRDPIICQVNFDVAKKQLIKAGKIPAEAESQLNSLNHVGDNPDGIKAINEAIINFLQRQFQLCGVHLINYLPSSNPTKNKASVNTDAGIAISHRANLVDDLVIVEAYKGARDGALALLSANEFNKPFIIFGFKKPILIFEISTVKHISYSNITRSTFSILITVSNEKKEFRTETIEFGMIDQQYFQLIDDFIKKQGINDDSFNSELREKGPESKDGGKEAQQTEVGATNEIADSDDEEEDGTYQVGVEQDDASSVAEEYDSNAGSDSNGDEEDEETNDQQAEAENDNENW